MSVVFTSQSQGTNNDINSELGYLHLKGIL